MSGKKEISGSEAISGKGFLSQGKNRRRDLPAFLFRLVLRINLYVVTGTIAALFIFLLIYGFNAVSGAGTESFLFNRGADGKINAEWYPTSSNPRFSILPLLTGTFMTALPAVIIASFFGIGAGIYLSEIAGNKTRKIIKPVIEIYAAIPTVAIGFIMLAVAASFFDGIFNPANRLNAFLSSLGLAIISVPVITSITDDSLRAVPDELRIAGYSLGAGKWQVISKIVIPAALRGISAAVLLGFSRAIGETMIVLMTSGNAANLTFNPFMSVRTITATIAAELGEVSSGTIHFYSLFFLGLVLFVMTFILNLTARYFILKYTRKEGSG